ncbi:hypothetical protein [Clostridium sp. Marseille-QA1073]
MQSGDKTINTALRESYRYKNLNEVEYHIVDIIDKYVKAIKKYYIKEI